MDAGVRNKLRGSIVEIKQGDIMSQVKVQVGDNVVSSVMTTESLREAGFREGDTVTAMSKAINTVLVK